MDSKDISLRRIGLAIVCLFACGLHIGALAAGAALDGLRVNVTGIYLSGWTADQDCTVEFSFEGPKAFGLGKGVHATRIISAVDDTGANLFWTNSVQPVFSLGNAGLIRHPATNAAFITVEGETELFARLPIFTNLLSRSGTSLADPILARYGVKLTHLDLKDASGTNIEIQVEDPHGKLLGLEFRHNDGSLAAVSAAGSYAFDERSKTFRYRIGEKRSSDLNLIAKVAVPETLETVRFQIEKVRLPWVPSPFLEVSAEHPTYSWTSTNGTRHYSANLNFSGGQMTNAFGLCNLRITRMLDDANKEIVPDKTPGYFNVHKSSRVWGNTAAAFFIFGIDTPSKLITLIEGDAEIYLPTKLNGALLETEASLDRNGEMINDAILKSNHVSLTFMGRADYSKLVDKWRQSELVHEVSQNLNPAEAGSVSLLFNLKDRDGRLLGAYPIEFEFMKEDGTRLFPLSSTFIPGNYLFNFREAPRKARVRSYLATPESLQKVHFRVEDAFLL